MQKPGLWALLDHPPAPAYYKGRIAIIGDAAHDFTPHQSSGAGMAIEDAYVLSNILGLVHKANELEPAFRAFDYIRRERSQRLVATSRDMGLL